MSEKELRELLNTSENKKDILSDTSKLNKYNLNIKQYNDIVVEYLNDNEKLDILNLDFVKGNPAIKTSIAKSIEDSNIIKGLLEDDVFTQGVSTLNMFEIINKLDSSAKYDIVNDKDILEKLDVKKYDILKLIGSLDDKDKTKVLDNYKELKATKEFDDFDLSKITSTLESDDTKIEYINKLEFKQHTACQIALDMSDESKKHLLYSKDIEFSVGSTTMIVSSMNSKNIAEIINDRTLLEENDISLNKLIAGINKEKQKELYVNLKDSNMSGKDKKIMLASLKQEVRDEFKDEIKEGEFKDVLDLEYDELNKIVLNKDVSPEKYKDLDELISVKNPTELNKEDREYLKQVCKHCGDIRMTTLMMGISSGKEYLNGEKWIDSVMENIDENWGDLEKIAYIDNTLGKTLSYSSDFDTEISDRQDARALWKILDSKEGVCNGFALVEQYMLKRLGIESEMISGQNHSFLKLSNIEMTDDYGNMQKGNTILDPTWNLAAHKFGARPDNFLVNYDTIRKADIAPSGKDSLCHKNEDKLMDATLQITNKQLREVYSNIGIVDKDGMFPIKNFIDKSKEIDSLNLPDEESIKKQLELVSTMYPDFNQGINSTMSVLSGISFNQDNLKFNKCSINRVYEKNDKDKKAKMYVYVNLKEGKEVFYCVDDKENKFTDLDRETFENRFSVYDKDLEKYSGIKPWDTVDIETLKEHSSGTIEKEVYSEEVR